MLTSLRELGELKACSFYNEFILITLILLVAVPIKQIRIAYTGKNFYVVTLLIAF